MEVRLDKWGRIYLPARLRHVLKASRFEARMQGDSLILTPIREEEGREARSLTYYFKV